MWHSWVLWGAWANNIGNIAKDIISRIKASIDKTPENKKLFADFLEELQDDLNPSITDKDAVEMLAQHIITKPVFEELFQDFDFIGENPVSKALEHITAVLQGENIEAGTKELESFYEDVRNAVSGINKPENKQKLILELYDKFFSKAFPLTTARLGIVYTPIEIVDFIIHSVQDALQDEFNLSLGDEGVHIIDGFTGTGTFTRLLQSGLMPKDKLKHKFKHKIHANEIVLLAYYIAAINSEATYHSIMQEYQSFDGICLTDTFAMYEKDDLISVMLPDNSERRKSQKAQDIKVIIGNPPYSAKQKSGNDNAQNVKYPNLDNAIADSYIKSCNTGGNKNSLYDSYIKAIKWGQSTPRG